MRRSDIVQAIDAYCGQCHGVNIGCINQGCSLWKCHSVDLSRDLSIEVISDAVMDFCQKCIEYHNECDESCHLSGIPT